MIEGLKIPHGLTGMFEVEAVLGDRRIRLGSFLTIREAAMRRRCETTDRIVQVKVLTRSER